MTVRQKQEQLRTEEWEVGGGSPCVERVRDGVCRLVEWLGIKGGSQGVLLEHGYTPPFKALERDVGAMLRMSSAFLASG